MTSDDVDRDSATRWFTDVGLASSEQPQKPWRRSRQVLYDGDEVPGRPVDGLAFRNPQDAEVHFRPGDRPTHGSSQARSRLDSDTGLYRAGALQECRVYTDPGRPQREEQISVEHRQHGPVYQPPADHNSDQWMSQPDQHPHPLVYPAVLQSHQQIVVDQNSSQRHSVYQHLRQPAAQFRALEHQYPSIHPQTVLQSHKDVLVDHTSPPVYKVRPRSQQDAEQQYLLVTQDMLARLEQHRLPGVVCQGTSQSQQGESRQYQHVVADSQRQLSASSLPFSACAGLDSQVFTLAA